MARNRAVIIVLFLVAATIPWGRSQEEKRSKQAKEMTPEEIIQAFTAKESQLYEAWNQYYYKQVATIKVLEDDGVPSDESMTLVFEVVFLDSGARDVRLISRAGRLRSVLWTAEDQDVISNYQPFALTTKELASYDLSFNGKEKVDELNAYVFTVKPKTIAPGKLYFQGKIWIDDSDLQIVRTVGKVVPQRDAVQFPEFETLRQLIDKKYWFPVYSHADSVLTYKIPVSRSLHVEETVTYEGFKRFTSSVTIKPVKK
jgi:hypothetical protein